MNWNELPKEIQDRMLECKEEQGNERNPDVFVQQLGFGKGLGVLIGI